MWASHASGSFANTVEAFIDQVDMGWLTAISSQSAAKGGSDSNADVVLDQLRAVEALVGTGELSEDKARARRAMILGFSDGGGGNKL